GPRARGAGPGLPAHPDLRTSDDGDLPARVAIGDPSGLRRALPPGKPPRGRGGLRRRYPPGTRPPEYGHPATDPIGTSRSRRGAEPAGVGPLGPGVRPALP